MPTLVPVDNNPQGLSLAQLRAQALAQAEAKAQAEAEAEAKARAAGEKLPWEDYQRKPWEEFQQGTGLPWVDAQAANGQLSPQVQSYISQAKARVAAGPYAAAFGIPQMPAADPNTGQPAGVPAFSPNAYGTGDSAMAGLSDSTTLGFGDEFSAGLGSLLSGLPYAQVLQEIRANQSKARASNPGSYVGGQIAGGLAQAAATGGAGFGANAARSGAGLLKTALGSAADGAILAGLYGTGSADGTDLEERALGGAKGAALGGLTGGLVPVALAAGGKALSPIIAPIVSRLNPDSYAQAAMQQALQRAGMTPDEVSAIMSRAAADGQDMFNVADALGQSGSRLLSTVVRNPNDARQAVFDALTNRQMGQGDRLSNFLAEGFGAPDTAAQRAATLTEQRGADAAANYGAARASAGPVNLNGTVDAIDTLLGRDPILGNSALSAGPLGQRLQGLRDQLQNGGEQLVDFNRVLNIKSDLYNAMKDNPRLANDMKPVYNALDSALEDASPSYRQANDAYRAASQVIGSVDRGTAAASGRTRAADNIEAFNALSPDEQNAFRAGYVDPLIARVENASVSPTTNKARMLMTSKTGQEFPVFAQPGMADQLGNRIAREQAMFETSNAALGGSKTADNLADAAAAAKFDPGVIAKLLAGHPIAAVMSATTKMLNSGRGMSPSVLERVAPILMGTDPQAARAVLEAAQNSARQKGAQLAISSAVLGGLSRPAMLGN